MGGMGLTRMAELAVSNLMHVHPSVLPGEMRPAHVRDRVASIAVDGKNTVKSQKNPEAPVFYVIATKCQGIV